ncbi:MAG: hypothetical protein NWP98_00625 [Erythrobacter sp.]|nr:hypothetical protein [Erythrobacter sp.]
MMLRAADGCVAQARHACRVTMNANLNATLDATQNRAATTNPVPFHSGLGAVLIIDQLGIGGPMTASRAI